MRCSSASNHVLLFILLLSGALFSTSALAQEPTTSDSTVTYPAEFFAQYEPFSVNDMLDRIPGISVARGNSGGGDGCGLVVDALAPPTVTWRYEGNTTFQFECKPRSHVDLAHALLHAPEVD